VDVWKILLFKKGKQWRLLLLFGIPGIIASFIGASIVLEVSEAISARLVGIFLAMYVFFVFEKQTWHLQVKPFYALMGGTLSGFFAGLFGLGGAIRSTFLGFFDLPKTEYLFLSGAIALLMDLTRVIKYLTDGASIDNFSLKVIGLAIPVTFIGSLLAQKLLGHIPQERFRIVVGIFIALVALRLLIFPVGF
jgi:uncharacterized membrane protein YfcA